MKQTGKEFYEDLRESSKALVGVHIDTTKAGKFTVQAWPEWNSLDSSSKKQWEQMAGMMP